MPRAILLLVTDLQIGGTPTVVRELAIRLNDPPAVRVDVACLAGRGPVAEQLESEGIRVIPLGARGAWDIRAIFGLARLICAKRYDTVFSFLVHANAAAAAVAPFFRDVRFLQSIQTTQPHPRWHWFVQSIVHHAAERVIVPSRSVAEIAERWSDIPERKTVLIPNAIDLSGGTGVLPVSSAKHGRDARATGEPFAIGFIGRLDPIKRIPDLLRAIRLLGNQAHLHIFGGGTEQQYIENLARDLNLADRVTLHGEVAGSYAALQKMDILVLPSAAEGFGLVLIEAMAARVPIVATNVAGIRDVVRDEQTGLLVPPFAPVELSRAIDRLLSDTALRDRLIAQAREDVARRFTWEIVLPQYSALLNL